MGRHIATARLLQTQLVDRPVDLRLRLQHGSSISETVLGLRTSLARSVRLDLGF
jgi:hypothetical protein